jgi:Tfp pilus assembly protein PilO
MHTRHADKLWMLGGVIAAAVVLLLGWFFFVGPQYAEAARLDDQAIQAQVRLAAQQRKLADLQKENQDLPQFKELLNRARQALPTAAGTADFLRELQVAGERASVSVTGLSVGARLDVPGTGGDIYALPVALTVAGESEALEGFLNELQLVQPRAMLIRNANISVDKAGTTLTLNVHVFVAPVESATAAKPAK